MIAIPPQHQSGNSQKIEQAVIENTGVKSANWHIIGKCNYNCKFCFSQDLDQELTRIVEAEEVLQKLREVGIEKINFTGGEPTIHPLFLDLVKLAKGMGFIVSIVSNGYYITKDSLLELSSFVDWIGLSIDSADEQVEVALGRGSGGHVQRTIQLAEAIHEAGIKLKINTTVTRLNWSEDLRPLIGKLEPERWKVFQVLHIAGQNDKFFNEVSISDEQFAYFKSLNSKSIKVASVFESNSEMMTSYFMLSPSGMAMSNLDGSNRILSPLENITKTNLFRIMDEQQYFRRGGIYSW